MSQINPKLRNFTERLIAFETKENMSSGTKIPGACLASEKLRPHLAALMGSTGVRALLARALALANADVPWLRAVHVKTDGSYEGFEDFAHVDPDEFSEGCVVLLSHLLGLLVAFIGDELTLRLVRQAWPKLSSNNFDLDEGGI
jgi:hypothetical protein